MGRKKARMQLPFSFAAERAPVLAGCVIDGTQVRYVQVDGARFYAGESFASGFSEDFRLSDVHPDLETVEPAALCRAALDVIDARGVERNVPIIFALPAHLCAFKTVDAEGLSLPEMRSVVRYDFERYFSFREDTAAYDVMETSVPCGESERLAFLLAASRRVFVEPLMRACEAHGFQIGAIEPAQASIERLVRVYAREKERAVFLIVGNAVGLLFLSSGGRTFFYHSFEIPKQSNASAGQAEIFESFQRSAHFVFSRYPDFAAQRVDFFHIAASVDFEKELRSFFAPIDVNVCDLRTLCPHFETTLGNLSDWIVPLGAALRTL